MHFCSDPLTFISTRHSSAAFVKPNFRAATAGNSVFKSGVVEKKIEATSSISIPFLFTISVKSSWSCAPYTSYSHDYPPLTSIDMNVSAADS